MLVFVTVPSIVVELIFTMCFEMEYMLKSYILHSQQRHIAAMRIRLALREFLTRKKIAQSLSGGNVQPTLEPKPRNALVTCYQNFLSWWKKNIEEVMRISVAWAQHKKDKYN